MTAPRPRVVQNAHMGRWHGATLTGRAAGGRILEDADIDAALAVCSRVPVVSVLAASRIAVVRRSGFSPAGGQLWGYERGDDLVAVCWAGANVVPVVPDGDPRALDAFARIAREQGRRSSSIVGQADAALGLWERLSDFWPKPRDVRANQPSLVIDHDPLVKPDPTVRRSARRWSSRPSSARWPATWPRSRASGWSRVAAGGDCPRPAWPPSSP